MSLGLLILIAGILFAFWVLLELLIKCYVAARTEKGALKMIVVLHELGFGVISDILGEKVKTEKEARQFTLHALRHIKNLAGLRKKYPNIRIALAVKPSQIGFRLNHTLGRRNLKLIYRQALYHDIKLEVDLEGPETIDDELSIIKPLLRFGNNFRQAISANQSKSRPLLENCAKLGIGVRLVKGAYPGDIEDPVLIDANYLNFAKIAKTHNLDVAYGTHDLKLLEGVLKNNYGERQMLFGVRPFADKDTVYMVWGGFIRGWKFFGRRIKEGTRPNILLSFLRNIPESLFWRLRYAPLSFFN